MASEPECFDFFQAVQLLERLARLRDQGRGDHAVGYDRPSREEAVRFRALPSRSFASADISDIRGLAGDAAHTAGVEQDGPPEMRVAFMGLTGPSGVLPEWYQSLLMRRIRNHDFALRDLLDVFNHRLVSLFYRAWAKYRFPQSAGPARLQADRRELFPWCLECLVGMGTAHLTGRLAVPDGALTCYGGHYSHNPRSGAALEAILTDVLGVRTRITQFRGRWLDLEAEDRTTIASSVRSLGRNACLGLDAVAGARVRDAQSAIRVCLGPLSYADFARLMPGEADFDRAVSLIRIYVGPGLDFDLELCLEAGEVPPCTPRRSQDQTPRLGWNTWLASARTDRESASFVFQPGGARGGQANE